MQVNYKKLHHCLFFSFFADSHEDMPTSIYRLLTGQETPHYQ